MSPAIAASPASRTPLQGLCKRCHSAKTSREVRVGRGGVSNVYNLSTPTARPVFLSRPQVSGRGGREQKGCGRNETCIGNRGLERVEKA